MNIIKQKQTHRHKDQTSGFQLGEVRGGARQGWGIKRCRHLLIK